MKKSQKGFTIIEVALVLAVAALIFLVVFLAVPALQRNQRNDAHKRDVSNVVEAVSSWVGNNPTKNLASEQGNKDAIDEATGKGADNELGRYIDTLSSNTESVVVTKNFTTGDIGSSMYMPENGDAPTKITVVVGATCDGTDKLEKSSARSIAVVGGIETAQDPEPYCSTAN